MRCGDNDNHNNGVLEEDVPMVSSGGRARMASISEGVCTVGTGELQVDHSKNARFDQHKYEESRADAKEMAREDGDADECAEQGEDETMAGLEKRL
jgi:hypothetical protein